MRVLEIALLSLLALRALPALASGGRFPARVRTGLALALAAVALAQPALEGARWQMIPALLAALVVAGIDLAGMRASRRGREPERASRPLLALAGLAGVGLLAVPPVALPVPRLPAPTGPFVPAVTTAVAERPDGEGGTRRVPFRVWYPSRAGGEPAPWLERVDAMAPALARRGGLPAWALSHLELVRSHAREGAAPALDAAPFPVVLMSHGRGGFREQSTFLAEELASLGYAVAAPDHPGGALLARYPDAPPVPFSPEAFGRGVDGAAYDAAIRAVGAAWAADLSAVLDALPAAIPAPLHADAVAAIGHSTGGGAVFAFCREDPRCAATVGLDPWLLPVAEAAYRSGVGAPLLAIFSDPAQGFFAPSNHAAFDRLEAAAVESVRDVALLGADHYDLSDVALLSPWADLLGLPKGPIEAHAAFAAVRAEVAAFLARELRGEAVAPPPLPGIVPSDERF